MQKNTSQERYAIQTEMDNQQPNEFQRANQFAAWVGISVGLISGLTYWLWAGQQISFEASSRIQLASNSGTGLSPAQVRSKFNELDQLWHSVDFLAGAVSEHQLGQRTSLGHIDDPIRWLSRRLTLSPCNDNPNFAEVLLRTTSPRQTCTILAALLASYRALTESPSAGLPQKATDSLAATRAELLATIQQKQSAYAELSRNAPIKAASAEQLKAQEQRAAELSRQRSKAILKIAELETQIEVLGNFIAKGELGAAWDWIDRHRSKDTPRDTPTSQTPQSVPGLDALRAKEAELLTKWGRNHPQVRAVRAQIDALMQGGDDVSRLQALEQSLLREFGPNHPKVKAIREQLQEASVRAAQADPSAKPTSRSLDDLQGYVVSLKQKVNDYQDELKVLEASISQPRQPLADDETLQKQEKQLNDDLQRAQQSLDSLKADLHKPNDNRALARDAREIMDQLIPTAHLEQYWMTSLAVVCLSGLISGGGTLAWIRRRTPRVK